MYSSAAQPTDLTDKNQSKNEGDITESNGDESITDQPKESIGDLRNSALKGEREAFAQTMDLPIHNGSQLFNQLNTT